MKRRFRALPLRRKLLALGVATASAGLLMMSAGFLISTSVIVRNTILRDTEAQASIVADSVYSAVLFQDPTAGHESLQALAAKRSIEIACAYDGNGILFAAFERDRTIRCPGTVPADRLEALLTHVVIGRGLYDNNDKRIGTLYLQQNLDEVADQFRLQTAAALASLALGVAVAFFIARRLQGTISEPVRHLAETSTQITRDQDYSVRATKSTDDEIGDLVEAFNAMLTQVQRRDAELSKANADLTREIVERHRIEEERLQLLKREREANRLKDEFLAALSHELRTPLNAILGWTQILTQTAGRDETAARALSSIERNARAQARMIEDLLDISRIVSGKLHLKTDVVDLVALADTAIDIARPAAAAKHIALTRGQASAPCLVSGDQDRLQQVLWNLLSNALKFTPPGGAVQVDVTAANGVATLTVRDSGIGISPEFIPHVFDRFRQADGTMAREHGGLGLGLAIVHDLIELHGGSVAASSEGRNRGATFTVRLPHLSVEAPVKRPLDGITGLRLEGISVLVVDDDEDAREIAAAALTRAGARVEAVESPHVALVLLAERRFDVVVSDIGLPGLDGYELLERLRSFEAGRGHRTRAVAMTAYASDEDVARAQAVGFDAHVAKPFNMATLVTAVAGLGEMRPPPDSPATAASE
jgi:signal transduction histidine kinase/CheY-like chemotaxis protein